MSTEDEYDLSSIQSILGISSGSAVSVARSPQPSSQPASFEEDAVETVPEVRGWVPLLVIQGSFPNIRVLTLIRGTTTLWLFSRQDGIAQPRRSRLAEANK